jgi:hypothetical protein
MKPNDLLPVDEIAKLFTYDPETGIIVWNRRRKLDFKIPLSESACEKWNAEHAGTQAFLRTNTFGYLIESVLGVRLLAHRVAFALMFGHHPQEQIDHINGVRTDNRIANLRGVSNQQNAKNQRRRVTNKSGATGVFWSEAHRKWLAQIRSDGKCYSLGRHDTFDAALAARKAAEPRFAFHRNHGSATTNPEEIPK